MSDFKLPGPEDVRNIKLTICYDGTEFRGWQRQPGQRTVQEALETAIERLTGAYSKTTACSRTDAGVHARGQVVHFLSTTKLPAWVIYRGLNSYLPRDLRVLNVADMPQSFHSTLDAISKRYRYVIDNQQYADPFHLRTSWHVFLKLDSELMHRAGQALVGRHDFHSFETEWPNRTSSVRTILDLSVSRNENLVSIEVEADGFLYNMVRAIAGTLMMAGAGKRPETWVREVLLAEDRTRAGRTAPAQGLCLMLVRYPEPRVLNDA